VPSQGRYKVVETCFFPTVVNESVVNEVGGPRAQRPGKPVTKVSLTISSCPIKGSEEVKPCHTAEEVKMCVGRTLTYTEKKLEVCGKTEADNPPLSKGSRRSPRKSGGLKCGRGGGRSLAN